MSTATATTTAQSPAPAPVKSAPAGEGRIGLRANLRHIGALVRRNALQIKQDPESMFDAVLMPIVFTLLFVYVFGGAISGKGNQQEYVNYVIPGLMAMQGMNIAMAVGTGVNDDFKKGVMDRFRSMPIARSSVLIAKIVVEVGRMLVATTILLGMGFLLGLEIHTSVLELFAAVGLSMVFGASLMWIFILLGLTMKTAQAVKGGHARTDAAAVRLVDLRTADHDARLAAELHRLQPAFQPRRRGPESDQRRSGRPRRVDDARLGGADHPGHGAARGRQIPQEDLIPPWGHTRAAASSTVRRPPSA